MASFYPDVYTPSPDQRPDGFLAKLQSFCEFQVFYRLAYASQIRTVSRIAGLDQRRHTKLLDVGCGHGVRLRAFHQKGCEVEGADIDAGAVDYVRHKLGIPAIHCNLDSLSEHFAAESFDIVTAFYLLEHLVDVRSSLVAIHRLLRPGGWFFGAVPLIDSTQAKWLKRRWLSVTEAPRHISLPARQSLMELMHNVGFEEQSLATHADSTLICAAVAALSLLPQTSTTHMATQGSVARIMARFLAGGLAMALLPWALADKYLLDTPSLAIVCGQKPF
ncbi:MAG: class I SAM-dependent methyltransferase [Pirellulales bacterium]